MNLTDKQKRFCEEYMIDFNATQAAMRSGYSEKTSGQIGEQNLKKLEIQNYLKELKKKAQEKLDITHTELLQELKNWAYSDITETINLTPEQVKELPIEVRRLIIKYKHTTITNDNGKIDTVELHFVSKEKAIEMIAKHIGFFEQDNKQKSQGGVTIFQLPDNGR